MLRTDLPLRSYDQKCPLCCPELSEKTHIDLDRRNETQNNNTNEP